MEQGKIDLTGGFSMVKVILSDALSTAAYHPDFQRKLAQKKAKARKKLRDGTKPDAP